MTATGQGRDRVTDAVAADLARLLTAWRPARASQEGLRREYLRFLATQEAPTSRDGGPEHVTGSCFVLTPDLAEVLLCFHRKGGFWVQLGGHVEPDDVSVVGAGLREAREEGGVTDLTPARPALVDLDRHALSSAFGRCRVHWDVGIAALAPAGSVPQVSDESHDVAWWPVDRLPDVVPEGFPARLDGVLAELRRR